MSKWTFATIALVTAAIVALILWLRYDFGKDTAGTVMLGLAIAVALIAGLFMAVLIVRMAFNAIGDFQRKDDKGEIERMRMIRAVVGIDAKQAKSKPQDDDDMWRDVTPLLAAPQTWTPAQLPAQVDGNIVYYTDGNGN